MIDIHTHLLPGLDNGSKEYKESEAMIDDAIKQGIDTIILTPHQGEFGTFDNKSIITRFKTFQKWFEKKSVKFYLGSEIIYSEKILDKIKDKLVLTMNGTNVVMLDFLGNQETNILDVYNIFQKEGYKVIIAHVEYYPTLTINDITRLKDKGALIQVDAETIIDKRYEKWVKRMIKERLIDFISSNAHTSKVKNCMKDAYDYVVKKTNEEYANQVFKRNQKNYLL